MKKRLTTLIGEEDVNLLMIGTFHAICCRLLHLHAVDVDLDASFTVADTEASKEIITRLRTDAQLKIGKFTRVTMKVGTCETVRKTRGLSFDFNDFF